MTGTVFSITIVALQLASGQFTPRVLQTFSRDRGIQVVLGVPIGTFTYALLVMRSVRSEIDDMERFVPGITVLVAILLALLSVACLIYFVHHVSSAIRVSSVIDRVFQDGSVLLRERFPAGIGDASPLPSAAVSSQDHPPTVIAAWVHGHVQAITPDPLFAISADHELVIRIEPTIGDFVMAGEPLASLWPSSENTEDVNRIQGVIRQSVVIGPERTLGSDGELPLRQLAEIAVKALSPSVNDPTTATSCIDHLGQLLVVAANQGDPPSAYRCEGSKVFLVIAGPSFSRLLDTAFAQVRNYGAGDMVVAAHAIHVLGRTAELVSARCWPDLHRQGELMLAAAQRHSPGPAEFARVDQAAAWLVRCAVQSAPHPEPSWLG